MGRNDNTSYLNFDRKISLSFGALLLILMIFISTFSSYLFLNLEKKEEDRLSKIISTVVEESIKKVSFSGKYHSRLFLKEIKSKINEIEYISIQNSEGLIIAHTTKELNDTYVNNEEKVFLKEVITSGKTFIKESTKNNKIIKEIITPYKENEFQIISSVLVIAINIEDVRKQQNVNLFILIALILIFALIGMAIVFVLSKLHGQTVKDYAIQLKGILDNSTSIIYINDSDGIIKSYSVEFERLFGSNLKGKSVNEMFYDKISQENINEILKIDREILAKKNKKEKDLTIIVNNVTYTWNISKFPIAYTNDGKVSLIFTNIIDVTEKQKYEKLLEYSERNYREIFNSTSEAIFIHDGSSGKILDVNDSMLRMYNYCDKSEIFDKNVGDFSANIDPYTEIKAQEAIVKTITEKPQTFEWFSRKKNGEMFWTEVSLKSSIISGESRVLAVVRDITERKEIQNKLIRLNEELEDKVRERTEQLEDSNIELLTTNNNLISSNEKLEQAISDLKVTRDKLIVSEKMASLGQLVAGIAHELNTPLAAIISSNGILKKNIIYLEYIFNLYNNLNNNEKEFFKQLFERVFNSFNDSFENIDREKKSDVVNLLEKMEFEYPEFYADILMAVGFYEPEDSIKKLLELSNSKEILKAINKLSAINRSINIIENASRKASRVVTALKTYSFYDKREEKIDINIVSDIELTLILYENKIKHGIRVIKNYESNPIVLSYPDKLNHVWMNIINNAIQAMNYQGTLEINVRSINDTALISFTDSGSGIDEKIKNKIFQPFFTTKNQGEGTGLGLDLSRKILEQIDGKIYFDSVPGRTTFTVELKLS